MTTCTAASPIAAPLWARLVAYGAFAVTVPSALWRILMIVGLVPDTAELRAFELEGDPALGYAYVIGLSAVQLAAGWLAVGLVRPWGERIGRWRIPMWPVVIAGVLGGLAVTYLFDVAMLGAILDGRRPDGDRVHGSALAVMLACYVPIFFWGPLVLLATYGYWRRRRPRIGSIGTGTWTRR